MTSESDSDGSGLLAYVLLPVANADDAVKSARALEPYRPDDVRAMPAVEKGGGGPEKTPVEQSRMIADASDAAVRSAFPAAEGHTAFARDIVGAISEVATEVKASANGHRSRGGGRIIQFLPGDLSPGLLANADRPVNGLPRVESNE